MVASLCSHRRRPLPMAGRAACGSVTALLGRSPNSPISKTACALAIASLRSSAPMVVLWWSPPRWHSISSATMTPASDGTYTAQRSASAAANQTTGSLCRPFRSAMVRVRHAATLTPPSQQQFQVAVPSLPTHGRSSHCQVATIHCIAPRPSRLSIYLPSPSSPDTRPKQRDCPPRLRATAPSISASATRPCRATAASWFSVLTQRQTRPYPSGSILQSALPRRSAKSSRGTAPTPIPSPQLRSSLTGLPDLRTQAPAIQQCRPTDEWCRSPQRPPTS